MSDIYRHHLAENSWTSATSAINKYLLVCEFYGVEPVPSDGITDNHLIAFISILTVSGKFAMASIRQYLSMGPRVLQLQVLGWWTSLADRPRVRQYLQGAARMLAAPPKQALGITPDLLAAIFGVLDVHKSLPDLTFFAACTVAFYGFLRKSNFTVESLRGEAPHCLRRSEVTFDHLGRAFLSLRSSKTNQGDFPAHVVPMPRLDEKLAHLCPSRLLATMLRSVRLPPAAYLFTYPSYSYATMEVMGHPLTYSAFSKRFRDCLDRLDLDSELYSSHSFRRGGATFAANCGVSHDLIKLQGDWKSDAYLLYCTASLETKLGAVDRMAESFARGYLA